MNTTPLTDFGTDYQTITQYDARKRNLGHNRQLWLKILEQGKMTLGSCMRYCCLGSGEEGSSGRKGDQQWWKDHGNNGATQGLPQSRCVTVSAEAFFKILGNCSLSTWPLTDPPQISEKNADFLGCGTK